MLTRENLREAYNQLAPSYNRWTLLEEYLFGVKRQRHHFLQKASGKVLEVAAGTGKNFPYVRSAEITAVDLNIGMLRIARVAANRSGVEARWAVMSAENLAFGIAPSIR